MKFRNISIILAFLSFELKVFSSPINDITSNIEVSTDEESAVETVSVDVEYSDGEGVENSEYDEIVSDSVNNEECLTPECQDISKRILNSIDVSVDPCDDFYQFTCGNWMNENEIPKYDSSINEDKKNDDRTKEILREILEGDYQISKDLNTTGQEYDRETFGKLKSFYDVCMDVDSINKMGGEPLLNFINQLKINENKEEYKSVDGLTNLIADLHYHNLYAFFGTYVSEDPMDPEKHIIYLMQPGVILTYIPAGLKFPKQFYESEEIVSFYKEVIMNTLNNLYGDQTERNIEDMTNSIVEFEKALADLTFPREYYMNIKSLYNKSNIKMMAKEYPNINWKLFFEKRFEAYGIENPIDDDTVIINASPEFFEGLNKLLEETDIDTMLAYVEWNIILQYIKYVADDINKDYIEFENLLNDITEITPRYKTCISEIDNIMGHALSKFYIEKTFSEKTKEDNKEYIKNIKEAMKKRILNMDWFDDQTKENAIEKVTKLDSDNIGYPDFIKDPQMLYKKYEDLKIDSESLFNSILNYNKYFSKFLLTDYVNEINKDNMKWLLTAQTSNAFYYPSYNSITLLAAYLQPPNYDVNAPDYLNYGGIGSTIGHELTHAFDNNGKDYDANGKIFDWWTNSTLSEFNNLSQCFIDQYNSYYIEDEEGEKHHLNGKLTLGENLADSGGLARAYEAWKNSLNGNPEIVKERNKRLPGLSNYTFDQLYFISYGQTYCENIRTDSVIYNLNTDPHSPNKFRVNGVVGNYDTFAKVFNCPKNSPMNPDKKCSIW